MYSHIVMWHLKYNALENNKSENAQLMKQKLESMQGKIPGLQSIEIGIDVRQWNNSADVIQISKFTNREALEAFHSHPNHEAHKPFVREVQLRSTVVDFEGG